jgi:hypothetical protein
MPYARTVAALALALGASSAFAGARPWTLVDAVAAPFIDDVQLAPDGRIALVEIDRTDVAHNAFLTNYRAVVVASGATAAMSDDLSRPRWSPDSKSIAWLAAAKGGNALVVTDSRGARRRIFPSGGRNVIALSWSPDGRSIAAIETSSASTAGPRLFWLTSESDYRGTRPPPRSLWLIDVATGTQREITRDGWSYGGPETDHDPSWASDGSRIALVRQPTPVYGDFEHAQYVSVQLSDGRVTQIVNHPFFAYPASAAPVFGPNGAIAYAHTWDGKLASREDVFVDGRDVSAALDRDLWSCSNGTIAWQGGMLIAGLMDGAAIRLFVLDPTGAAAPKPITPDDGSVVAYSIAADGTIAYLWTTPQFAPELFVRSAAGTTRQVTQLSRLSADLPSQRLATLRGPLRTGTPCTVC